MVSEKQLSPIGGSSVPVPNRMLRLLKKATSISDLCPGSVEADGEDLEKDGIEEDEMRSDLEGLGVEDGVHARKALDFDSVPELNPAIEDFGEKSEEVISEMETREETRVSESSVPEIDPASDETREEGEEEIPEMETRFSESSVLEVDPASEELGEKSEEEIPEMETREETREAKRNNKKSKKTTVDFDELPASMNMTKKERREYLDQLRAENQRLLRETRDAAFEPVPLVRKPISSVLEKIRRRKEEISKQFLSRKKSKSKDLYDGAPYGEEVVMEEKDEDVNLEFTSNQNPDGEDSLEDSAAPLGNSDSPSNKNAESNPTQQDPSLGSQTTSSGEEHLEKTSTRSVDEVMTPPSVLASNLKRNPSPAPDNSEEAEYTKESYDPETHDSSPGDPVRKFIDEVAEEEDDSDNDLLRFEDDDEDEDEEDDDLRDMIASQFKEDPSDKYKRNELHQKWLEQQDAAGTEKLLHKLKRGLQQDETSLFEDEDDNADDENMAEDEEVTKPEASEDENEEDPSHATSMRMRIKKIKEMIPLMFTDKDDVYVSSDDEETEKKLMQQRLYKKRLEQKAKLSSSTGNEHSEEILRHIKKPEIGKKAKTTSFKDRALMGINKNPAASKSSFLGKLTKSSISEGSRKRGSNVVRGYIFERDDSNSKSSNSVPEEPSVPETIVQEKSRPRRAPAKFTASQSQERSTTSPASAAEEKSTRQRTTLYEILKMSSKKTSFTSGETVISSSHTESIFAAFKLDTKPLKTNPQVNTFLLLSNLFL
ncbi:BnaA07g31920D [Brassica napus]|uniref:BnaA07g31920D protein n=1 Tax=Brassica napus TaxID=3708 RepID=A0A078I5P7_BRANA|nr:BnaA07g31920D [Brassica napus]